MQQEDLRAYLSSIGEGLHVAVRNWRKLEAYRALLPAEAPDYLKELFCSNVRAILEMLEQEESIVRPRK